MLSRKKKSTQTKLNVLISSNQASGIRKPKERKYSSLKTECLWSTKECTKVGKIKNDRVKIKIYSLEEKIVNTKPYTEMGLTLRQ
jgi:hypothetical protein